MANNPILDQNALLPPALETPLASVQTPRLYDPDQTPLGLPPAVGTAARPVEEEEESASIPTLVTWNEGGKNVYVTGTFAENGWKARLKMNKRFVERFSTRLSERALKLIMCLLSARTTFHYCSTCHRARIDSNSSLMTIGGVVASCRPLRMETATWSTG
jgi:hypothetical protein